MEELIALIVIMILLILLVKCKNNKKEHWKDMDKLGKPDYLDNRLSFILY